MIQPLKRAHILEGQGQALEAGAADDSILQTTDLRAGSTLLVPAGVWHAVRIPVKAR